MSSNKDTRIRPRKSTIRKSKKVRTDDNSEINKDIRNSKVILADIEDRKIIPLPENSKSNLGDNNLNLDSENEKDDKAISESKEVITENKDNEIITENKDEIEKNNTLSKDESEKENSESKDESEKENSESKDETEKEISENKDETQKVIAESNVETENEVIIAERKEEIKVDVSSNSLQVSSRSVISVRHGSIASMSSITPTKE